jgi:hypothetical protein
VLTFPLEDMPYILTILLERAPVDAEVHLQIKGITSHDPVEGDLVFGLDVLPLGRPYPDPDGPPDPTPIPTPTIDWSD